MTRRQGVFSTTRVLNDIAQTLDSVEAPEIRLKHVLRLLRFIVTYDRSATLEAVSGDAYSLTTSPAMLAEETLELKEALNRCLSLFLDGSPSPINTGLNGAARDNYMVVPLVSLDVVMGVMFVGRADPPYTEEELGLFSLVASQLAAYLANLTLYRDAQEKQRQLRAAAEAKDEFLALISHEIRTPITVIGGYARSLRVHGAKLDEEASAGLLSDMEQEVRRLTSVTENLMLLARSELGETIELEPVLLQRLLPRIVSSQPLNLFSARVEVQVQEGLEPVAAQSGYLEQVFINLLSNAVKFAPPDSTIEIRAEQKDRDEAIIRVLDRGVGVSAQEAPLLFERFYRTKRTEAVGSGLGLTVCKRIIEALRGSIQARPREGGGLEVRITLPLCRGVCVEDLPSGEYLAEAE